MSAVVISQEGHGREGSLWKSIIYCALMVWHCRHGSVCTHSPCVLHPPIAEKEVLTCVGEALLSSKATSILIQLAIEPLKLYLYP